MIDVRNVAVAGAAVVTVIALFMGQDGPALTAFFGFLAGLGLARSQTNAQGTAAAS